MGTKFSVVIRTAVFLNILLLAACGGGGGEDAAAPPASTKAELQYLTRFYSVKIDSDELGVEYDYSPTFGSETFVDGLGVIDHTVDLNPAEPAGVSANSSLITRAPGETGLKSSVYSDKDGTTYWVDATAPFPTEENLQALGAHSVLTLDYYYRKDTPNATLSAVITNVILEGLSYVNPDYLGARVCPAEVPSCIFVSDRIFAEMEIVVRDEAGRIVWDEAGSRLLRYHSASYLWGGMQNWSVVTVSALTPIWDAGRMEYSDAADPGATQGTHATYKLSSPVELDIPLKDVPEYFWVTIVVHASATNATRVEEPYRAAYFRDPLKSGAPDAAVKLVPQGLTALKPPGPRPAEPPVEVCSGPADPLAGTLQFEVTDLHAVEMGVSRLQVKVSRSGGTKGDVSVDLTSSDGTAIAGADYKAVNKTLRFYDGQGGTLEAEVIMLEDDVVEAKENFTLALGNLRGCAALGTANTANVTVHDLDYNTYTLGGTVTGLVGSGLTIGSNSFDVTVDTSGPFTLPGTFPSGTAYDLQVEIQPGNPIQTCRVTNGQGTIGSTNVTDLAVECDPPAPPADSGSLDPAFAGGKVFTASMGKVISMSLQADGSIVALTDASRLLRYLSDGTLDPDFGAGGVVNAALSGNAQDLIRAVALQADGGILVAGLARAASGGTTAEDMGIKRYLPDGTVDTSFGSNGFVRVDIAGRADDATAIIVQPDGKIVLGGNAMTTLLESDLALVRLDATGALDAGFGSGGKLTANIGHYYDSASALALQPDGAIVLVGRAATGSAATPDTSVLRVFEDGVVDLALKLPLTDDWDEATGVAIQSDGKIVLTLDAKLAGGLKQHALARLNSDGTLDTTFGAAGVALASFSLGGDFARDLKLLADGRIVTVGIARNNELQLSDMDDFLVTRHLADGSLDTSFGTNGWQKVDFFGGDIDAAETMLVQPDGSVVAGGFVRSGTTYGLGLIRLLP